MRGLKAKILLALASASTIVSADCGGTACYNHTYTSTDIGSIVIDNMGAVGVFFYDNITLLGILLLLGFIVGVFVGIKRKAGM